jgi:hypothetical protein
VSVVSISTFSFNDVGLSSIAAIMNFLGSNFSHLGQQVWILESVFRAEVEGISGFYMFWVSASISFICSMCKASKRLCEDNKGVLFICCFA